MNYKTRVLLLSLLLTLSLGAQAAETPADVAPPSPAESGNPLPARDDEWRYSIAFPMIWAPDINGKIRGDEPIDFEIPFSRIYASQYASADLFGDIPKEIQDTYERLTKNLNVKELIG